MSVQMGPASIIQFESFFFCYEMPFYSLNHHIGLSLFIWHFMISKIDLVIFLRKTSYLNNYSYVLSSQIVGKYLIIFSNLYSFPNIQSSCPVNSLKSLFSISSSVTSSYCLHSDTGSPLSSTWPTSIASKMSFSKKHSPVIFC